MSPQTALITGCSRGGIGEALAIDLANRGFHVFAGVRTLAKAPEYVSPSEDGKAKGAMQLILVDVASTDSIRNMVAELKEKLPDGKLDILINNAGIGYTKPVLDADIEDIKRLYDVNFFGILSLTQACIPMLLEAKGKIVNISSIGAVLPLPWNGIYGSSKAALTSLSETLRLELAPLGVTVVTAMVGMIGTNFRNNDVREALPATSQYTSVEPLISDIANGKTDPKSQPAKDFAKNLVDDVLGGASGQVYRGSLSTTGKLIGYHAPGFILDRALASGKGLDQVAKNKT